MAEDSTKTLIILGIAAVGAWYLYEQGYLYQWTGMASLYPGTLPSTTPTTTTAPTTTSTPGGTAATTTQCGGGLTPQDAATLEYNSSITAEDMDCVQATLDQELSAGSITQILGTSVLAYMLGWGGAKAGATQSTSGWTYKFDGTNWNIQSSGTSGIGMFAGYRIPARGVHGMGIGRIPRGWVN
jgi:hypothetical protein